MIVGQVVHIGKGTPIKIYFLVLKNMILSSEYWKE